MFREMRKSKQQLAPEETLRILKQGKTGVLGLLGDGGYPYTVPVNYVYTDGKVYFHCAKAGHKLDAIRGCPKVSLCVVAQDQVIPEKFTTHYKSVILFGQARILDPGAETVRAAALLAQKYAPDHPGIGPVIQKDLPGLCCVEIAISHMTGKASAGSLP